MHKQIGRTKFDLLSAIPAELRSTHATLRFEELARKFRHPAGEPKGKTDGCVVSPISQSAAAKMTDEQWLRAIAKYHSEDPKYVWHDPLKGGARELARVLRERVEEEPRRFARLSLKFPEHTSPLYIEHTLMGLKTSGVETTLKLQVCVKAFAESVRHCGTTIADVLGGIEERLPDHAIQMLDWLATEHDETLMEGWREESGGDKLWVSGISTTRGRAVEVIQDLILRDAEYIERFRPTIGTMIRDRNSEFLSCVAGALRAVSHHNPTLGTSLFWNMDLADDRLLAKEYVREMIYDILRHRFPEIRPVVERMIRSSVPEVCEAGGRFASLAALEYPGATDLAEVALLSNAKHRLGVAHIASGNVAVPEHRAWCEAKLVILFNDSDSDVRSEAASCFADFEDDSDLEAYEDLIAAFCDSRAFKDGSFWLVDALDKSLGRLPQMTYSVCKQSLDRDTREKFTIARLIFRMYQQHRDDEWTTRSLDLIDRLCLEWYPGAEGRLDQFDRERTTLISE